MSVERKSEDVESTPWDFFVEIQQEYSDAYIWETFWLTNRFLFRDSKGNLLWYIRAFIERRENAWRTGKETIVSLVDIVSSYAYGKHMTPGMETYFLENGYVPGISRAAFGVKMMEYVLMHVREQYPEVKIVVVNSLEANESHVWQLIEQVKLATGDLITQVSWGWEMSMATLFLNQDTT